MNIEMRTEQTAASRQQSQWLPVTVTGIQNSKPPRLEFYSVMTLRDGEQATPLLRPSVVETTCKGRL